MAAKTNLLIFCISLNKGGAERVISLMLNKFIQDEDICLHLILMEDGIDYDLPTSINMTILNKNYKSGVRKLIELPFVAWQLSKYLKENKIDTVMSFLYRPNYVNILAKFLGTKHKSIINIRSTTSRYLNEGLLGKINLFLVKLLFNNADLIVSNSQGVENDLKTLMSITTKTKVIHNPVDLDFINEKKETCDDIPFHFDKQKKYIISVGRLIPLKRNKDLIDAFHTLQNKDDDLQLILLGEGKLKNKLIEYCKKLQIQKKVHFLGNVTNPFYYLYKSDLFVMTSEIEGFPNVVVEAMACGLPVISSDCKSGPREILGDNKYGLLYPVGDVEALRKHMQYYLYNENINPGQIKQAEMKRLKDFKIEKIMKEFESIL